MKIKDSVLKRLDNNRGYALIMLALDCSHSSARDYIKHGSDNLTKAASLKAIREEFDLKDSEILEDVPVKESQN
jgi:hypothetical protein